MSKTIYKENQKYNNLLILGVLALSSLVIFGGGIKSLFAIEVDYSESIFLITMALLFGVITWYLAQSKVKVAISKKKIKCKTSSISPQKYSIAWEDIEECEIVKTSKADQWSGGNITFNHEKMISMTGRNGLAIKTKEGESYFIGFKNLSKLKQVMSHIAVS